MQKLPGGRALVGWATQASFTKSADGKAFLDGNLKDQDVLSYRAFRFPWSATPKEPPALATNAGGAGYCSSPVGTAPPGSTAGGCSAVTAPRGC